MSDDPFACFDGDDDDDSDENESTPTITNDGTAKLLPAREEEFGVLAFHRGTEQSLLTYVMNHHNTTSCQATPASVMKAVDDFCVQRHWMMHVGPEKKCLLETCLQECVSSRTDSDDTTEFVLLELGTYCGYSSILWASALQNMVGNNKFHVYSVEANLEFAQVARKLIDLAGLTACITVLDLDVLKNEKLVKVLATQLVSRIDLLFIDHDKQSYLEDLQALELAGLVRAGVHVVADNVLFARIDDYREYMQTLSEQGIVQSRLEKASLEYSEVERQTASDPSLYEDGIEVTVYLRDHVV